MPLPKRLKSFTDALTKGANKAKDRSKKKVLGDLDSKMDSRADGFTTVETQLESILAGMVDIGAGIKKALRDGDTAAAVKLAGKLPVSTKLAVEGTGKPNTLHKQMQALARKHGQQVALGVEDF